MKLGWVVAAVALGCAIAVQASPYVAQGAAPEGTRPDHETSEKGSPVRTGVWGGRDVIMKVNEQGATIEFACATGNISEPLLLDATGKFRAHGTFQRQHGGPARRNEPSSDIDVIYTGTVEGDTMKLEFVLPEQQQQGPFTLVRGQEGRLRKCG
jgi:hypothetical protein